MKKQGHMQGYVDMYDESARTRSTVTLLVPGTVSLGGSHVLKTRVRLMLARADGWLNRYHHRCESYLVLCASSRVNVRGCDHSAEPLTIADALILDKRERHAVPKDVGCCSRSRSACRALCLNQAQGFGPDVVQQHCAERWLYQRAHTRVSDISYEWHTLDILTMFLR